MALGRHDAYSGTTNRGVVISLRSQEGRKLQRAVELSSKLSASELVLTGSELDSDPNASGETAIAFWNRISLRRAQSGVYPPASRQGNPNRISVIGSTPNLDCVIVLNCPRSKQRHRSHVIRIPKSAEAHSYLVNLGVPLKCRQSCIRVLIIAIKILKLRFGKQDILSSSECDFGTDRIVKMVQRRGHLIEVVISNARHFPSLSLVIPSRSSF